MSATVIQTPYYTCRWREDTLEIWTPGPMGEPFYSLLVSVPMDLNAVRGLFGKALAKDIEQSLGDAMPTKGPGPWFSGASWVLGQVRWQ